MLQTLYVVCYVLSVSQGFAGRQTGTLKTDLLTVHQCGRPLGLVPVCLMADGTAEMINVVFVNPC